MRTTLVALGLLLCASAASAQTDYHLYGGGVLGGKEFTRGGFGGVGISSGQWYGGTDGHGLWLNEDGEAAFRRAARRSGADLTLTTYGLDASIGYVARNAANRVHFIPVALIGYTTGEFEACIRETFCDTESETTINFGAGFVTAFKGESGNGLHAGFRYTRNYGAAISVGFIWQVD